jgi:hypothetical protein
MKEAKMAADWRTIQFFLSEDGVFEVEADSTNWKLMKCSCPKFLEVNRCSHVTTVKKQLRDNEGVLSLTVPEHVEDEELYSMSDTPDSFRDFVLKYGKPGFIE